MKIRLGRVWCDDSDSSPTFVVETAAGGGLFRIHSKDASLAPGDSCSAELSVDEVMTLGHNAWLAEERAYRLEGTSTSVTMVGWVDGVDDGGLVYFRLGVDALVMLEAVPQHLSPGTWLRVTVAAEKVTLYAFDRVAMAGS